MPDIIRKAVIVLMLLSFSSAMGGWKPAGDNLKTRWADKVNPDNPLPGYPRPQMVRDEWTNLNGLWDYAIVAKDSAKPEKWDGKILVPFCAESSLSGVMKTVGPKNALWYHRTFTTPNPDEKRLLLHFGGVDWDATVWINGKEVGRHKGGYDTFTFDITDHLRKDTNEIVVRVWDPADKGNQPRGKQVLKPRGIWYTAVTGIWQTVWLESVPKAYIRRVKITPDVDKSMVRVLVNTNEAGSGGNVDLNVSHDGNDVADARGKVGESIEIKVPDAKLWSSDSPFLYDLEVTMGGDTVKSYFGMRKIEVKKDRSGVNRLFLNGRPLFHLGPLDQGWWPDGLYTAPTDEALKYDIEVTKKLGYNCARKHVKVETARWYYWCDKLGLMVWQDMPNGNNKTPEAKLQFRKELRAVTDTLYNHPSIVMWVPFNEGWGQHGTVEITEWLQSYDPTRLVNNVSGWHDKGVGDVHDKHSYPGPAMPKLEDDRAAVLGEFGGLGLPIKGHLWKIGKHWGYRKYGGKEELTENYRRLLDKLRPLYARGLAGAIYTQTTDCEGEVNGLMTYDRAITKLPLSIAKEHEKFYQPPPIIKTLAPAACDTKKAALWRYTTKKPADGWQKPGFDDSGWKKGQAGFGAKGTPGAIIGTEWNGSDIWLRRTFETDKKPAERLMLKIHHDEDAEVYINGVKAADVDGYTTNYVTAGVEKAAAESLKSGTNTIAIHCRQTDGGQYIDAGLVVEASQDKRK